MVIFFCLTVEPFDRAHGPEFIEGAARQTKILSLFLQSVPPDWRKN
jgi:hypothetical protein